MLLIEDKIKDTQIRFFLGYSGWGSSQLDEELENKSWFVSENNIKQHTLLQNRRCVQQLLYLLCKLTFLLQSQMCIPIIY